MNRAELLSRFDDLNLWQRGAERAPHKPLLVLHALGRLSRGQRGPIPFREIAPALTDLLREFGPSRKSYHPEYPFWRLQNDGVWTVHAPEQLVLRVSNTDPRKSELLKHGVSGAFSDEVQGAFEQDPGLIAVVAERLLEAHFSETMHADIVASVGLDLGPTSLALDAAHIQWHQANGPDLVSNGLALCTLHHTVFDRGAFTIAPDDLVLLVSDALHGAFRRELLLDFHGRPVRAPDRPDDRPDPARLHWHRREVFKGEPRHVA